MVTDNLDRLERQVALDKEELNALIRKIREDAGSGGFQSDPVIKNRIRNIQDNLYYLEAQLDIARRELESQAAPFVRKAAEPSVPNPFANNPTEPPQAQTPMKPAPSAAPTPMESAPSAAPTPTEPAPSAAPIPAMTLNVPSNVYKYTPDGAQTDKLSHKELSIFSQQDGPTYPGTGYGYPKKSSLTEEVFGKNVMAIAASGLIFISLILFAIVFVPALGTAAKVFMMFAISFAFLIAGVYMLEKKGRSERSGFFEAVSGCGMGAIFVSLFISNIHFKVMNDLMLYIFLFIWAVVALFLSKRYESRMYSTIGQIGITVSIVFGCLLFIQSGEFIDFNSKFIILLIYFFIGSFAYLYFDIKTGRGYFLCNVFHIINLGILIGTLYKMMSENSAYLMRDFRVFSVGMSEEVFYISLALLAVDAAFMLICCFIGWDKEENLTRKHSCGLAYTIILLVIIRGFAIQLTMFSDSGDIIENTLVGVLYSVLAAAVMVVLEYRLKDDHSQWMKLPYWLWTLFLGYTLCYGLDVIPGAFNAVGMVLAVAAFIIYGFIADNEAYRVMGYVSYVVYLFAHFGEYYVLDTVLSLVIILGAFYIMFARESYDMRKKTTLYLLLILCIIVKFCEILIYARFDIVIKGFGNQMFLLFVPLAAVNTAATLTAFRKDWMTKDEEPFFKDLLMVLNAILIFAGMALLYAYESRIIWVIAVLILIAICCINVKRTDFFFHDYKYVYAGVKFTILIYVILNSASAAQAAISIACFLLAIACIALGFYKKYSNLRMYGLVLSMVCIVKLVMFDIAYDNTLGHAISFFISGLLCFVISAIYNYVGKRMND